MPTNPYLTRSILPDPDKWADAACVAWGDPEIWFPDTHTKGSVALAVSICQSCPLQQMCATEFRDEEVGIFGGLTPAQRQYPSRGTDKCGTMSGYNQHRRWREKVCQECSAAMAEAKKLRDAS